MYVFSFHHCSHTVLIETLWNVNLLALAKEKGYENPVLIETLWNVNFSVVKIDLLSCAY